MKLSLIREDKLINIFYYFKIYFKYTVIQWFKQFKTFGFKVASQKGLQEQTGSIYLFSVGIK